MLHHTAIIDGTVAKLGRDDRRDDDRRENYRRDDVRRDYMYERRDERRVAAALLEKGAKQAVEGPQPQGRRLVHLARLLNHQPNLLVHVARNEPRLFRLADVEGLKRLIEIERPGRVLHGQ